MNKQGNTYTFLYAAILVVVVAAVLSFVALSLKPMQTKNIKIEKMQNILASVKINDVEANEAEKIYNKLITKTFVVNVKGEVVEGVNAFDVDLSKEVKKKVDKRNLPVFIYTKDGVNKYIIPVRGKGLWGPIWGFISLNDDKNTVYGAIFDHQGETPGLGAEIANEAFQKPFSGKQIHNESGKFVSIEVHKAGKGTDIHSVDGISGGTMTSKGVDAMLKDCLSSYEAFLKK
ncbi:NADH:ubiquinone reductase (Na(+)-transporting) subunit C [Marinilabiliaceae bacterium JC040]|nr:NADH:ubiquinone reductase (Na(+)-transporting) subunit C [Marinilabiliaceae bacterium JC040]